MELFCFKKQSVMLEKKEGVMNSTLKASDGAVRTRRRRWIILKGDKPKYGRAAIYKNMQEANPRWRGFLIVCRME